MNNALLLELYSEICNGFSFSRKLNLYFKHFSTNDVIECERAKQEAVKRAAGCGMLSSDDLLKQAIKDGRWSEAKNLSIKNIESDYRRLSLSKTTPISIEQLDALREELVLVENEWDNLISERYKLICFSQEAIGDRAYNDRRVFESWYRDKNLIEKAYTLEDFLYLEDREFTNICNETTIFINRFNMKDISNICISDFFQRRFSISKDLYDFFGKPSYLLTDNQINLLKLGEKYHTMLSEIDDLPDDFQGPEGIEDYFYLKRAKALPSQADIAKQKELWD